MTYIVLSDSTLLTENLDHLVDLLRTLLQHLETEELTILAHMAHSFEESWKKEEELIDAIAGVYSRICKDLSTVSPLNIPLLDYLGEVSPMEMSIHLRREQIESLSKAIESQRLTNLRLIEIGHFPERIPLMAKLEVKRVQLKVIG